MDEILEKLAKTSWNEVAEMDLVRSILVNGHFHTNDAFPDVPLERIWKAGLIWTPANELHNVQFTFTKPGKYNLWCWTCKSQYCPAAIALMLKTYAEEIKGKYEAKSESACPVCGQPVTKGNHHD